MVPPPLLTAVTTTATVAGGEGDWSRIPTGPRWGTNERRWLFVRYYTAGLLIAITRGRRVCGGFLSSSRFMLTSQFSRRKNRRRIIVLQP